jgi:hypothetical protein
VTPTYAVSSHEIGVAELANRSAPIAFSPSPEVATRKPAEDRWSTGMSSFTLQRVEDFFDRVGHHAAW